MTDEVKELREQLAAALRALRDAQHALDVKEDIISFYLTKGGVVFGKDGGKDE